MRTTRTVTMRDAVHGDMMLYPEEIAIIDTPEFQRLRGIKQLGTASLVFPSAVHTRFEHSIGTCHMAQKLINTINERQGGKITKRLASIIRIAALLHDITHVPYGHTFEDERKIFPRHDEGTRPAYFLLSERSCISRILKSLEIRQEVYDVINAKSDEAISRLPYPFAADIVSHTMCADLFDYLRRDTYFTGLKQDYDDRIFSFFEIDHQKRLTLRIEKGGILRRDILSEVLNLLRQRYTLTERVYYHHAKVASGAMLSKAVESAKNFHEELLSTLRDDDLLSLLGSGKHSTALSRKLVSDLKSRQLYKRAYVVGAERADAAYKREELIQRFYERKGQPRAAMIERQRVEAALAKATGIPKGSVIIYCPKSSMYMKEAAVRVILPNNRHATLSEQVSSNPARDEVAALNEKYSRLWKFYVFIDRQYIEKKAKLARACYQEFRLENELDL